METTSIRSSEQNTKTWVPPTPASMWRIWGGATDHSYLQKEKGPYLLAKPKENQPTDLTRHTFPPPALRRESETLRDLGGKIVVCTVQWCSRVWSKTSLAGGRQVRDSRVTPWGPRAGCKSHSWIQSSYSIRFTSAQLPWGRKWLFSFSLVWSSYSSPPNSKRALLPDLGAQPVLSHVRSSH